MSIKLPAPSHFYNISDIEDLFREWYNPEDLEIFLNTWISFGSDYGILNNIPITDQELDEFDPKEMELNDDEWRKLKDMCRFLKNHLQHDGHYIYILVA